MPCQMRSRCTHAAGRTGHSTHMSSLPQCTGCDILRVTIEVGCLPTPCVVFEAQMGTAQPRMQLQFASCDAFRRDSQVRTRNEVLLPSFQHGVGDPVEDSLVVATHHTLVLVEGNYLLIGAPNRSPVSLLNALLQQRML